MGTGPTPPSGADSLSAALFGKTRRMILGLLYTRPDETFYLRQIARLASAGQGSVQRELQRLTAAGILTRTTPGRNAFYQANPGCPVFDELKGLLIKTAGVADVLRLALLGQADRIRTAFVYGSAARAELRADSDIDLLVIGEVGFGSLVESLAAAQKTLSREVNPSVYTPAEFRRKVASGHQFLTTVLRQPKVFIIGDSRELDRLASKPQRGGIKYRQPPAIPQTKARRPRA